MAGLLFAQVKEAPGVPLKLTETGLPLQASISAGWLTTGMGLTVMVNETGGPSQFPSVGVIVMVPVCGVLTLAAVRLILPLPEAGSPMAVLLLVQLRVAPAVPEKLSTADFPAHMFTFPGWSTMGAGLIVMVKVLSWPGQPFSFGVTVNVAVSGPGEKLAVKVMLPVPEADSPMAGLSLVQSNMAPGVPLKLTTTGSPPQAIISAGLLTTGSGSTSIVKVSGVPMQPAWVGVTVMVAVCGVATFGVV